MITGLFGADFTAFKTAVDGATLTLKGFETDSEKVEKSLSRIGDKFSGKRIVQEAELMASAIDKLGGVSVLTAKELEQVGAKAEEAAQKLRAVGQDVPDNVQKYADAAKDAKGATDGWGSAIGGLKDVLGALGIGLTIDAVVNFGKEVLESASSLEKMHAQTGISVEDLQRLESIGAGVGVSLDTITGGAAKLEAALGSGDKGVSKALQDMNIDIDDFKKLDAVGRFDALSQAVQGMHDPMRVAADLSGIFGKQWTEQLPVLQKGFKEAQDGVIVWSSDTVQALDDGGNAVGAFWLNFKRAFGESMADLLTGTTEDVRQLTSEIKNATIAANNMHVDGLVPARDGLVDVSGAVGLLNDGLDAEKTKIDAAVVEQKKFNDAWKELNSVGATWKDTLAGIDQETQDAVSYYLAAGASQGTLAAAYHLTAEQVKALAEQQKDYGETLKAVQKIEGDKTAAAQAGLLGLSLEEQKTSQSRIENLGKAAKQIEDIHGQVRDAQMKASLTASDYEIVKVWDVAAAKKAAFDGDVSQRQEYNDAVDALASAQEQSILEKTWHAADEGGKALNKLTDDAKKAKDEIDKTAEAARNMQGGTSLPGSTQVTEAGGQRYLVSPDGHRVPLGPHGELPDNWFDLYTGRSSFPGRAGGGPVDAGSPYLVGERGPELFVPQTSGTVVPGGGAAGVVNHIYVNGTAEDVARKVAAEIMRTVKAGQQLGAMGT